VEKIGPSFGAVWPLLNHYLLQLLVLWRSTLGGDLEKALIIGAVVDQAVKQPGFGEMSYSGFLAGELDDTLAPATNVQSIADYTGIPRETVRRKVNDMVERGWLVRDVEDGGVRLTALGIRTLDPTTRQTATIIEKTTTLIADIASDLRGRAS